MRIISIRDDVEQAVLQYVRSIPEIFLNYDVVELVGCDNDRGLIAEYDIVFVESEDYEVVLGEVRVGTDLMLEVEIYE